VKWREEVLDRTGKAPLSVKGHLVGGNDRDEDLFKWFINAFWARIRHLDLLVQVAHHSYSRPSGLSWDFPQNPALSLESVKLQIIGTLPEAINDPGFSLFSNDAPSLRSYFDTGIPFTIEAPWFSQLRRLYLYSEIHLHRLFEILSRTPFLELLQVEEHALVRAKPEEPTRHINLIYLNDIRISASLSISVILLERIVPAQSCRLCLHTYSFDNRIHSNMLATIESIFSRYSHYYFDSNFPRHFLLSIHDKSLTLSALLQPTQNAIFPEFHVARG
jgi:hypothetical protein